ncbi:MULTISPECIES: GMC oxidoreductase [unclassified Sphingobacterium]|uniref:GMC oxidoreductase n=1 Tax=unclassified Sphingobacterium TaxID=2609468 RepID=UPI0025D03DC3|nr:MULTISPECIES: GMC family oxidoreductase [unclassified Sphingobacterium]
MMNDTDFDVIVVGSGISGGWAAKEFCEKGFKTLVIERGRMVKHIKDYPTANMDPWQFSHHNAKTREMIEQNPVISKHYNYSEATQHFYIRDKDQPYIQEKPFDWIRGYQVGGKSLLWARQTQRWSDFEFNRPLRDGFAVDWPIRYSDLAPWYSHVEKFVGISGNRDNIDSLPDSEVVGAFEMNVVEKYIKEKINTHFKDRHVIIGRCANLAELTEFHRQQGRMKCQARSLCERGCPFGGYFSSNASTLPYAEKTGNLTLMTDTLVESIVYDEVSKKASAVQVIDAKTKERKQIKAKVIFLNSSTLNSNLILMNSKSVAFPKGLGNKNDILGRYIAFHNYRGRISATIDGFEDAYHYGRRPTNLYVPSFRNLYSKDADFQGGYMMTLGASRSGWSRSLEGQELGADYKDALTQPGGWSVYMSLQGETIPVYENHVRISDTARDSYGIPQLITSVAYTENDDKMMHDFFKEGVSMLEKAGCKNIQPTDHKITGNRTPGLEVHEVGGVRMGRDPETSMLNANNQLHHCPNVFVTDGACMTSMGVQNPSLTFMALTARAANFAADQLREGIL